MVLPLPAPAAGTGEAAFRGGEVVDGAAIAAPVRCPGKALAGSSCGPDLMLPARPPAPAAVAGEAPAAREAPLPAGETPAAMLDPPRCA